MNEHNASGSHILVLEFGKNKDDMQMGTNNKRCSYCERQFPQIAIEGHILACPANPKNLQQKGIEIRILNENAKKEIEEEKTASVMLKVKQQSNECENCGGIANKDSRETMLETCETDIDETCKEEPVLKDLKFSHIKINVAKKPSYFEKNEQIQCYSCKQFILIGDQLIHQKICRPWNGNCPICNMTCKGEEISAHSKSHLNTSIKFPEFL